MRPEIRQILLTMVLPLFLIFILYMIKVLEDRYGLGFSRFESIPFVKNLCWYFQLILLYIAALKHLLTNTVCYLFLSWGCSFLLLQNVAPLFYFMILKSNMEPYIPYRQACLAYRRHGIIYGLAFFLFQRTVTCPVAVVPGGVGVFVSTFRCAYCIHFVEPQSPQKSSRKTGQFHQPL